MTNNLTGLRVTYAGHNDWCVLFISSDQTKVKISRKISDARGYTHKWVSTASIGGLAYAIKEGV